MHSPVEAVATPRPRGSFAATRSAGIVGLGSALPPTAVPSAQIAAPLGLADGWIERRTGIRSRRHAAPDDRLHELAAAAARDALENASMAAGAIDLVLVATVTQDEVTPGASPQVAHAIGARHAGAVDIGAACSGFVAALSVGAGMIESGRARNVLAIGAEILSRHTDARDKRTAGLFGDGAGAAVLAAGGAGRIGSTVLHSDGSGATFIRADRTTGLIQMDGHETYQRAVASLTAGTHEVLAMEGIGLDDVDLFVFHQANGRILTAVAESLGIGPERVLDVIADLGNTSAASIPLALVEAGRQERLWPAARVLMAAVGAGFTSGAALVEWGG